METGRCADANRRRLQCDSRGHRLSQPVIVGARCFVSAGAASPISCDVGYGLYGCVPVVARGRNWTLHVLGLLSAGVPKQEKAHNGWVNRNQPFIVTAVNFPTVGCWEVTARYTADDLTFVVWISK